MSDNKDAFRDEVRDVLLGDFLTTLMPRKDFPGTPEYPFGFSIDTEAKCRGCQAVLPISLKTKTLEDFLGELYDNEWVGVQWQDPTTKKTHIIYLCNGCKKTMEAKHNDSGSN